MARVELIVMLAITGAFAAACSGPVAPAPKPASPPRAERPPRPHPRSYNIYNIVDAAPPDLTVHAA